MYYILNCNNKIVGNIKGYRTMRGAQRMCSFKNPILTALQRAYDTRENPNRNTFSTIVCESLLGAYTK
jgi:hypothetical protein